MYKFYMVPDATTFTSHSEIYGNMQLFWDPYAESDAYAIVDPHTKGELNKSGSLEFTVLPANIHYNDFHKKKTVVIVFDDNEWIYEGVVTDAPIDFFKQRKVTCIDPLSYFCDSVQFPDEKNQTTVATSGSVDRYMLVDDTQLAGANPKTNKWYEQIIEENVDTEEETVSYTLSKDTSVLIDKQYYYKVKSSGKNYSGLNVPTKVPTKETVLAHLTRLVNVHNSQVDPFKQIQFGKEFGSKLYTDILKGDALTKEETTKESFSSTNHRNTWDALKNDILDEYGRYFTISRNSSNELCLNYIELSQMSDGTTRLIEFTNNMLEMNEANNNDDDTFTVLLPIGKNNLTVKNVSGHDNASSNVQEISPYITSLGGKKQFVVVSPKALRRYGVIIKTETFSDVSKSDDLYDRAVKYIKNNYDVHKEYEVKAIDLHFLDKSNKRIKIGDKCLLRSKWHEVDTEDDGVYFISVEHDLVNPENDSYTIGVPTADREAYNKTLTGQSSRTKSKASEAYSGATSGSSTFHSVLEDYIKPGIEWGLEISSSLVNDVKKEGAFVRTRFEQDNEHIKLMAEKVFGESKDSDYEEVPASEIAGSNPKDEGWYDKDKNGIYTITSDTVPVSGKKYYRLKLYKRISEIQVDGGGIHQRVEGNYKRSIASASWIDQNESSIKAVVGHLHYDEETGEVIIDAGSGLRTGSVKPVGTTPTYRIVPKSSRTGNPAVAGWFEEKLDSSTGAWLGLDKTDSATNKNYYKKTTDTEVVSGKNYYYKNEQVDQFTAEYGVYHEDNLDGGVVVRMINYPSFVPVPSHEVQVAIHDEKKPANLGWYTYDEETGTYGIAPDEKATNKSKYFERSTSESQVWTKLSGDHITVGSMTNDRYYKIDTGEYPSNTNPSEQTPIWYEKSGTYYVQTADKQIVEGKDYYSTMDGEKRTRIQRYIKANDLVGTITEISSDITSVNNLFAKYIEADKIVVGTALSADTIWANKITSYGKIFASDSLVAPDLWIRPRTSDEDANESQSITHGLLKTYSKRVDGVDVDNETITASTSGDTVTLSFKTADNVLRSVSFDKPASLGTATWSNGEESGIGNLTVKTEGGKKFFFAKFDIPTKIKAPVESDTTSRISAFNYRRNGFSAIEGFENIPTIQYRPKVQYRVGKDEDNLGNTRDIGPLSTSIYVDVSSAYNDGVARTSYSSVTWATDPETNDALLKVYSQSGMIFYADIDIPKKFHETDPDNRYTYAYYRDGLSAIDGFANTPTVRIRPSTNVKWAANEASLSETWVTGVTPLSQNMYVDVSKVYNDGHSRASYKKANHTIGDVSKDFLLKVTANDDGTMFYADYSTPSIYEGTDDNENKIITYNRNGKSIGGGERLKNKPTLKAELRLMGRWGSNEENIHEDEQWISWYKDIFFDASDAYDDGYNVGHRDASYASATHSKTDGQDFKLNVKSIDNNTMYYAEYSTRSNYTGSDDNGNPLVEYYITGGGSIGGSLFNNKPTLKTTLRLTGRWGSKEENIHEDEQDIAWKKDIFIDATEAYNSAISTVHAYTGFDGGMTDEAGQETINLDYGKSATIKASWLTAGFVSEARSAGIKVTAPSLRKIYSRSYAMRDNGKIYTGDAASDSEGNKIELFYGESVWVYPEWKYVNDDHFHERSNHKIIVEAPMPNIRSYGEYNGLTIKGTDSANNYIDLEFGTEVKIIPQYYDIETSTWVNSSNIITVYPPDEPIPEQIPISVDDDIVIGNLGMDRNEPTDTSSRKYHKLPDTWRTTIASADGVAWIYFAVSLRNDSSNVKWYKVNLAD